MANIVIAGYPDCAQNATCELLADRLSRNLPHFNVCKIVKSHDHWKVYAEGLCRSNGWSSASRKSPIVWRELCGFGGKRLLIGGAAEFQEYAVGYYGQLADVNSCEAVKTAKQNILLYQQEADNFRKEQQQQQQKQRQQQHIKVCITGADSPLCYAVIPLIVTGFPFGEQSSDVSIYLIDRPEYMERVRGMAMEVEDCASPNLVSVVIGTDITEGFRDANLIILFDTEHQGSDESTETFTARYWQKYYNYGRHIDTVAAQDCLVPVCVSIGSGFSGSSHVAEAVYSAIKDRTKRRSIVCIFRLYEAHMKSMLSTVLGCRPADIKNAFFMGFHASAEQLIYVLSSSSVSNCPKSSIVGPDGYSRPVSDFIRQEDIANYTQSVSRTRNLYQTLAHVPALSAAVIAMSQIRDWWCSADGISTLGIISEGWYGVPNGVMFFFPVRFSSPKSWTVVEDIRLSSVNRTKLKAIIRLTQRERNQVAYIEMKQLLSTSSRSPHQEADCSSSAVVCPRPSPDTKLFVVS